MKLLRHAGGTILWVLLVASAPAEVRVFIQDSNALAWVKYECAAGEVVRAFALDVTVDKGRIIGISNFLRGPSTAGALGYGVFPASFRDHLAVGPGTNVNWDVADFTPMAVVVDHPGGTQPGLGFAGVTLEFGGLWDPADPAAVPGPAGTLCSLSISEQATVSVAANAARGGVVSANPAVVLSPTFVGAVVHPPVPLITGFWVTNGLFSITVSGGELVTGSVVSGPYSGTGNTNGLYTESVTVGTNRFFRVRGP